MRAKIEVTTPNGFTVTLETPEFEDRHKLLDVLPKFEAELLELGYNPVKPIAATPAAPFGDDMGSFPADTLVGEVLDGQAYWKIKGGPYKKFGVRVWDEVLEEVGITPEELNPLNQINLSGWLAYYQVENGKPKKVVKLQRAE